MTKSLFYSIFISFINDFVTVLTLPFMVRQPIDLPPIVSVELIQISDKTNIPFAPKARKIIRRNKKKRGKSSFRTSTSSCKSKRKT